MSRLVRTALTAVCAFTILAAVYLSASLFVLAPTHADDTRWAISAGVIAMVGLLTLYTLAAPASRALRYATAAGAVLVAVGGAASVYRTISGTHFEGYALVLGAALVVQAGLSLSYLARPA